MEELNIVSYIKEKNIKNITFEQLQNLCKLQERKIKINKIKTKTHDKH